MKVIITGHTRGIGKAIHDYFVEGYDCSVVGFSRTTGYDIIRPEVRKIIVDECRDADVFVNNAYSNHNDSQIFLLKAVMDLWWQEHPSKTIINVSSNYGQTNEYGLKKEAMDNHLRFVNSPRVINLKPGYVDTDRVANIDQPKMSTDDVIEILDFALNSSLKIEEIKFRKFR